MDEQGFRALSTPVPVRYNATHAFDGQQADLMAVTVSRSSQYYEPFALIRFFVPGQPRRFKVVLLSELAWDSNYYG